VTRFNHQRKLSRIAYSYIYLKVKDFYKILVMYEEFRIISVIDYEDGIILTLGLVYLKHSNKWNRFVYIHM
jgi:hypothetical protein